MAIIERAMAAQKKNAIIREGKYAIVKTRGKCVPGCFACINDGREVTLIVKESKLFGLKSIKVQKAFKLITFDMILPFSLVGFIAKITSSLAKAKIPIFVISAYSTDHLLIKEKYLEKAKIILTKIGFKVIEE